MIRTIPAIQKTVTGILTADWHLREDTPLCFTGDFQAEQWRAVDFVRDLQRQYDCPVLNAGDLYDFWKPSPWLITMTLNHLPDQFLSIYGQHDLPSHQLDLVHKCGMNTLEAAGRLTIINDGHWGTTPKNAGVMLPNVERKILVWHIMNYRGKLPWPDCPSPLSGALLRKYPDVDLLITGDNHQAFVEEHEGRLLVNPGSLTRQDADQIDFKPRVYLWYAADNTVEPVYIPIEQGVISREHLDVKTQRDARLEAFVAQLSTDWKITMDFEHNIEVFMQTNQVRPAVSEIVHKAIE